MPVNSASIYYTMRYFLKKLLPIAVISLLSSIIQAQNSSFNPDEYAVFATDRPDGRYISTRAYLHRLMKSHEPRLKFRPTISADSMKLWQADVAQTMSRLMKHPDHDSLPAPIFVSEERHDGYTLQHWELYPLPEAIVPFMVLLPDDATATTPAPGILCIPGYGQPKEFLADETNTHAMARLYAQEGYVAVVMDNPGQGEVGDLEREAGKGVDLVTVSRQLLEMDWNYLGLSSYIASLLIDWMETQPYINSDRLIVSGFSLGTEPLMAVGVMRPEIYAFVYNDYLCSTRERALTMTKPDAKGNRPWPNNIEHLIPGFLLEFDFPDIVAALAPRPVICTEGGMDRDFSLISAAYEKADAPDAFEYHHYAKYNDPSSRTYVDAAPEGITREEHFRLANIDPPHHYFKDEFILPWLRHILGE